MSLNSIANNCARVKLIDCRLISLMFSQREMGGDKNATGIIRTIHHGSLHVDLEDCILAGYSVFTPNEASEAASYTTKGKVQAYVHYRKKVPKGFEQLGFWPTDLFSQIARQRCQDQSAVRDLRETGGTGEWKK